MTVQKSGILCTATLVRRNILLLATSVALMICLPKMSAQTVTLAWNPSPSASIHLVTGYSLYAGYDGTNFPLKWNAGTNTTITLTNLQPGAQVYFRVTAYSPVGESPPSQQVPYFVYDDLFVPTNSPSSANVVVTNASNGFAIVTSGSGTITPTRKASAYVTGQTFSVTAVPARGWILNDWVSITNSGATFVTNVLETTTKCTFTVQDNMVLQANFVTNSFSPVVVYRGLFYNPTNTAQESSGAVMVSVTSAGNYTARLQLGAASYAFSGQFLGTGESLPKTIARPVALGAITVSLQLDPGSGDYPITGSVSNANWVADLLAYPAIYSRTNLATNWSGKYTMLIPGDTNGTVGHGFGNVTVTTLGAVSFSGVLGDGTAVTLATDVSGGGLWPFYASLYGGKGSILGWLSFTNISTNTVQLGTNFYTNTATGSVSGQTFWFKTNLPTAKLYPGGFTNSTDILGSIYTNAESNLGLSSSQLALTLTDSSVAATNFLTFGAANTATDTNSPKNKLTFKPTTGQFKGSVTNLLSSKPISVSGIILQAQNVGAGYFPGTTNTGTALLEPEAP